MAGAGGIRILTGDGKGKTTSAVGLAWQAADHGLRVFMVQFLKARDSSGEHFAVQACAPGFTIESIGKKGFIRGRGCEPMDSILAQLALEAARKAMLEDGYDLIILDEVNVAVHLGLISPQKLLDFLDAKPPNVRLVLTGRYAHPDVMERADSVLELHKVKHCFDNGICAQKGIEF